MRFEFASQEQISTSGGRREQSLASRETGGTDLRGHSLDLAVTNVSSNTVSILLNTVFSLGFDSPTVTAQAGTTVRVTVNINRSTGFTGNVTVTPPDPAMGIKSKPNDPKTTTDTKVKFELKIKGSAPLGPHTVTFTARDDSGHTSTETLTVIVR